MITDKNLRVSTDQAVTTTAVSTDTIDLSVARDIGEGKDLYMNFAVTEAFAGGTSTNFEVIIADNAALSSNVVVVGASGATVTADLTLGKNIAVRINPLIGSLGKRYIGARYTVSGTNTAGKVLADIVETIQDGKKFYASGFSVV
jgi:hypothetical protein